MRDDGAHLVAEVVRDARQDEAYDRMEKSDVKYRFVIDSAIGCPAARASISSSAAKGTMRSTAALETTGSPDITATTWCGAGPATTSFGAGT